MYIEMMENDNTMLSISRAVTTIKTAILQSQARTIRNANSDVLALYYAVGQYISAESRTQKWGSGAIKNISEQLRKELPGLKGFSERSIRYMRQFYEVWCNYVHQRLLVDENEYTTFLQPAAAKISEISNLQPGCKFECRRNLPANGYVEYVIQRYDSPVGVAKYHTSVDMLEELRKALPDIDSLKRLLSESNDV